VEHRAIDEEGRDLGGAEAVVQPVGVLGVFVEDRIAYHHVTDAPVEGGGLTQHVHTPDVAQALGYLHEDVIRGQAEGIVYVQDDRVALRQSVNVLQPDARVEIPGVDAGQLDNLRIYGHALPAWDVVYAVLLLLVGSPTVRLAARFGLVVKPAGCVVE